MPRASITMANCANSGGAKTCTIQPEICTVSEIQTAITDLIRLQNPHKAWAFICDMFGVKERAAKHRLANTSSYTIEELQILLQGEHGLAYLNALMADAEPEWWFWTKQVMAQAAKRRLAAEATQEALQLEAQLPPTAAARRLTKSGADATKKLNTAFARKETALGFLRPDSNSAVARAMAATRRK
jgi:hypothetical protein